MLTKTDAITDNVSTEILFRTTNKGPPSSSGLISQGDQTFSTVTKEIQAYSSGQTRTTTSAALENGSTLKDTYLSLLSNVSGTYEALQHTTSEPLSYGKYSANAMQVCKRKREEHIAGRNTTGKTTHGFC